MGGVLTAVQGISTYKVVLSHSVISICIRCIACALLFVVLGASSSRQIMPLLDELPTGIKSVDDIIAYFDKHETWDADPKKAFSPVYPFDLEEFTRRFFKDLRIYIDNPPSPTIANGSQEVNNQFRILRITLLTVNQGMFTYTLPGIYVPKLIQTGAR